MPAAFRIPKAKRLGQCSALGLEPLGLALELLAGPLVPLAALVLGGDRRALPVGLGLERRVVIDRHAADLSGGLHAALPLLNYVPRFVRQVLLLARAEVNLVALRVSERAHLSRF